MRQEFHNEKCTAEAEDKDIQEFERVLCDRFNLLKVERVRWDGFWLRDIVVFDGQH